MGHEVATYYKKEFELIDWFLDEMVFGKKQLQVDEWYNDPTLVKHPWGTIKPKDMKKFR